MWSNLLTGLLAVVCIALALAVRRTQTPPTPSSELRPETRVSIARVSTGGSFREETSSDSAERVLDRQLAEFSVEGVPFDGALDRLADAGKANLLVDWVAIDGAGIERDAPVRLRLYRVSIRDALRAIFGAVRQPREPLDFLADGNVIRISTADQLPQPTTIIIYDVTALLNLHGDHTLARAAPASKDDTSPADKLAGLIVESIAPDSWVENGGRAGSIRALMGRLVVRQTPENHRQIAQLLRQLASGGQPILPATQPTRKDPKPLPEGGNQ